MNIHINESLPDSYSIFDNTLWKNDQLTVRAKFLYHYLANRPKNWTIQQYDLRKICGDNGKMLGEKSMRQLNKELIDAGYMKLEFSVCPDSKKAKGRHYVFSNKPIFKKKNDNAIPELVADFKEKESKSDIKQGNTEPAESAVSSNSHSERTGTLRKLDNSEVRKSASINNTRELLVNNKNLNNNKSLSLKLSIEDCFSFSVKYVADNKLNIKIDKNKIQDFIDWYNNKEASFKAEYTWQDALSYRIVNLTSLIREKAVKEDKKASKESQLFKLKSMQEFKKYCEKKAAHKNFYKKLSMKLWKDAKQDNENYKLFMQKAFKLIKSQIVLQRSFDKMEVVICRELNL